MSPSEGGSAYEVNAHFEKTLQLVRELEAEMARLTAQGDEVRASQTQARIAALKGPIAGGRTTAQVEETTAAIQREREAIQGNVQLELFRLDVLKKQQQAYLEQQELMHARGGEQLSLLGGGQRAPALITPAGSPVQAAERAAIAQRLAAENAAREKAIALENQQLALDREREAALARQAELAQIQTAANERGYRAGVGAAAGGGLVPGGERTRLSTAPPGVTAGEWTAANAGLVRYNVSLGEYDRFAAEAKLRTDALDASLIRTGLAAAESSNELRRHGALTTEWIGALARGETTLSELGYQLGATTAKFAGWAGAAAATYAVFGAFTELGKGAIDSASGVQQLQRTIDNLDPHKAAAAIQQVSKDANVPIKEASDAMFQFSRTFHDVDESSLAATLALRAYKLDGVQVADTVKAATALHQQFGVSAQGLVPVFDMLAQGQQKFNARLSEQIPLLQRSAASVKNAGGSLNDFLALSTVALRTTQLSGSQLGTIFQRSAANFLSPNTTKGQADLGVLRGLGIDTSVFGKGQGGFTKLLEEMLAVSPRLSDAERGKMAAAFAGPQLGGRAAGFFAGSSDQLLKQVQDQLKHSQGTLGTEFSKEAHTARQEMASFANGLQRLGAAFGDTGAMQAFSFALHGIVSAMDGVRHVIDAFNQLPAAARETVTALVAIRGAMLLLNRTRFGASIPGSRFARIPGIDPTYEAQSTRAGLARGTRQAINQVEQDVASSTAKSVQISSQQASLARQRAQIEKEITAAGGATEATMDRRNAIDAKILALDRQLIEVEGERAAQLETLGSLKQTQVGLTRSRFSGKNRMSDEEVGAMGAATSAEAASAGALASGTAADQRLASLRRKRASLERLNAVATGEEAAALEAETIAVDEAIVATSAEMEVAGGRMAAMGGRLAGLAAAMDPMLVAIVGIPIALSFIGNAANKMAQGANHAKDAMGKTLNSLADLRNQAKQLDQAAHEQAKSDTKDTGILHPINTIGLGFDALTGKSVTGADVFRQHGFAAQEQALSGLITALAKRYQDDAKAFGQGRESRDLLDWSERTLRAKLQSVLANSGLPKNVIGQIMNVYQNEISKAFQKGISDAGNRSKGGADFLNELKQMDPQKQIAPLIQSITDRADVFNAGNVDMRKAAEAYLYLAQKFRNSTNQKDLQLVKSAQQAFANAVNKSVQDLEKAAASSTTFSGAQGDLNQAVALIHTKQAQVRAWAAEMEKRYKGDGAAIKAIQQAADQLEFMLNDNLKSAISSALDNIKTHAELAASTIQGYSPEADIQRAEVTLQGLRQALAKAEAEGADWSTIAQLMIQINDAARALVQQQVQNARSIIEAQGRVAVASVTGTGPGADISRGQASVSSAAQLLSFDQSHGAGEAQILGDQASLLDAQRSLNQQIQQQNQQVAQNLQSLNDAQAKLAESQTQDPVKQARIELDAAMKNLALIKPENYQSQTEYLAALDNAKAAVNEDKQKVQDAIVQQDLDNLRFEHDVHKVGDQQYINGLREILRSKKLSLAERHQILEEIYHLSHDSTQGLNLNVGNIKLPSVYEIRHAIGLGKRGELPGSANTVINHTAVVTVNVYGPRGAAAVGTVLDHHLGTSVKSAMRAKGV